MARIIGQLEASAIAWVQLRRRRVVGTGDLATALRITPKQERELLSRMTRSGMIAKVRRGLHLFPERLPLGGTWVPDDATAINALMTDRDARYQITGLSAFNRYGYDQQIPSRISLYTDALSGERRIGGTRLTLIKVDPRRLGATEVVTVPSGQTLVYSSRARTLVDAVYDWSRFDTLPRAYGWIVDDIEQGRVDPPDLVRTTIRYGNLGTIRRIGAILERVAVDEKILKRMTASVTRSTAKIPLVPNQPTRGEHVRRWGVVVND